VVKNAFVLWLTVTTKQYTKLKILFDAGEKNISFLVYKHIEPLKKRNLAVGLFEEGWIWYCRRHDDRIKNSHFSVREIMKVTIEYCTA